MFVIMKRREWEEKGERGKKGKEKGNNNFFLFELLRKKERHEMGTSLTKLLDIIITFILFQKNVKIKTKL